MSKKKEYAVTIGGCYDFSFFAKNDKEAQQEVLRMKGIEVMRCEDE